MRLEQCQLEGSRIGLLARAQAKVTMTRCSCGDANDTAVGVRFLFRKFWVEGHTLCAYLIQSFKRVSHQDHGFAESLC